MSNLSVLSLRNRALIALITIVSAVFGGLALTNLKQELIPSLELPALMVMTTYPGASPEVVENDVSTPIEDAIQGVPGLESTTATSTTNASIVQATFTYGTNLATAEQKMQQAINRIGQQLPKDVTPQVLSVSIDDFPVIQIAVTGFSDAEAAQNDLQTTVIPDLEDVKGVNAAQIVGGVGQRITITPDAAKLAEEFKTAAQHEAQMIIDKARVDAADLVARREKMAEDKIAAAERTAIAELRAKAAEAATVAARGLIKANHSAAADKTLVDQAISGI